MYIIHSHKVLCNSLKHLNKSALKQNPYTENNLFYYGTVLSKVDYTAYLKHNINVCTSFIFKSMIVIIS